MKTSTLSEKPELVETRATVWDRFLGLGRWMDEKEAELDKKSFREQAVVVGVAAVLVVYFGLGIIRCGAVILVGTKVSPEMLVDWWWVALLKLVS